MSSILYYLGYITIGISFIGGFFFEGFFWGTLIAWFYGFATGMIFIALAYIIDLLEDYNETEVESLVINKETAATLKKMNTYLENQSLERTNVYGEIQLTPYQGEGREAIRKHYQQAIQEIYETPFENLLLVKIKEGLKLIRYNGFLPVSVNADEVESNEELKEWYTKVSSRLSF